MKPSDANAEPGSLAAKHAGADSMLRSPAGFWATELMLRCLLSAGVGDGVISAILVTATRPIERAGLSR